MREGEGEPKNEWPHTYVEMTHNVRPSLMDILGRAREREGGKCEQDYFRFWRQ